jgi:four helix bundle protein
VICDADRVTKISRPEDLVAWQLSMELADLVDAMVSSGPAARNRTFCDQIQKSSAKVSAQISEGFLRFNARESAYYYRIARASLGETRTHLKRGYRRKYWSEGAFKKAWAMSEGALNTTTGLLTSRLAKIKEEEQQKRRAPRTAARKDPPATFECKLPGGDEY